MSPRPSPFTLPQQVALALIPKISGMASALLSLVIVVTVAVDPKRRTRAYHRLVGGLSLLDFSCSLWLSLTTWPIPRSSGVLWASGTDATCRLQGFFIQLGVASTLYNASLSLYFVLVICRGWKEHQVREIEPYLHAIPILWALGTASAGLGLGVYGSADLWCWARPSSQIFRWTALYGPLWLMIIFITGMCLYICVHIRKIEAATDKRRVRLLAQYSARRGGQEEGGKADLENSDAMSSPCRCHGSDCIATASSPSGSPPGNGAPESATEQDRDALDPDSFGDCGATARIGREDLGYGDDGLASHEECVASSVFEDVVLSRTNQTLRTTSAAGNRDARGCPQCLPSCNNNAEIEAGDSSNQGARASFLERKGSMLRRQLGQRLLARDELRLKRTRQVARQSFLYAGAFYLNWTALSVRRSASSLFLWGPLCFAFRCVSLLILGSHILNAGIQNLAGPSRENVLSTAAGRRPDGSHPGSAQLLGVPHSQRGAEPVSVAPTLPPAAP
jgi:hypothetical protein